MEKNIIQSLWIGKKLGTMEKMCIHSYLRHGHKFHLYVYEKVDNVPGGVVLMDAALILPKEKVYKDQFGGFVNLSNLFRYSLLYQVGGWWVDMDTVCLKKFDFIQPFVFSSEFSDRYERILVNTTFIKCPKGALFLLDCINFIEIRGYSNLHWGELGVNLLSRMIMRHDLQQHIMLPVTFCPISPYNIKTFFEKNQLPLAPEAYAIHWWNELWRRYDIDKEGIFDKNSIYEILKSINLNKIEKET